MAKFTIDVDFGDLSQAEVDEVIAKAAYDEGYRDTVPNATEDGEAIDDTKDRRERVENPQSKEEFLKERMVKFIEDAAEHHDVKEATRQARQGVIDNFKNTREKIGINRSKQVEL